MKNVLRWELSAMSAPSNAGANCRSLTKKLALHLWSAALGSHCV
jgi:hypothetical protein